MYINNTISSLLDKEEIERVKKELEEHYNVKTIKKVDYILGIKIKRMKNEIQILQKIYVNCMLEKLSIVSYKPRSTLLPVRILFSSSNGPETNEKKEEIKKVSYWKILGLLIWLQVAIRPDLLLTYVHMSRKLSSMGLLTIIVLVYNLWVLLTLTMLITVIYKD